jgi:hypothetical protein
MVPACLSWRRTVPCYFQPPVLVHSIYIVFLPLATWCNTFVVRLVLIARFSVILVLLSSWWHIYVAKILKGLIAVTCDFLWCVISVSVFQNHILKLAWPIFCVILNRCVCVFVRVYVLLQSVKWLLASWTCRFRFQAKTEIFNVGTYLFQIRSGGQPSLLFSGLFPAVKAPSLIYCQV